MLGRFAETYVEVVRGAAVNYRIQIRIAGQEFLGGIESLLILENVSNRQPETGQYVAAF